MLTHFRQPTGNLCHLNTGKFSSPQIARLSQGNPCPHCETLAAKHGHLNKVAHLCSQTAASKVRLIDSATHPVIIPWGIKGKKLCEEIRRLKIQNRAPNPNRSHYRRAQQFTVQVYDHDWQRLKSQVSLHCDGAFAILEHSENSDQSDPGFKRPEAPDDPSAFCL